jgi:hypothetical protein
MGIRVARLNLLACKRRGSGFNDASQLELRNAIECCLSSLELQTNTDQVRIAWIGACGYICRQALDDRTTQNRLVPGRPASGKAFDPLGKAYEFHPDRCVYDRLPTTSTRILIF